MQFWPRKRSKRSFARIRKWQDNAPTKLQAFIGYKAGMTHIIAKDNSPNTMFKNIPISVPVTVIECPPIKTLSLRFYQNSSLGLKLISEVFSKNIPKDIKKYINLPKKEAKEPEEYDDVRLKIYTQPRLTGIGQKKPELMEVAITGDKKEKLGYGKSLLEKDIRFQDIFKDQKFFDIHSITKGKGFQGTVKRFGVTIRQHKSEKTKRGIGSLGSWTPKRVLHTVPQSGRMGHHQRVEYNKQNILFGSDTKKINPKGGFLHYGLIKNDYILIKGSVPGPAKRTIVLTPNIRKSPNKQYEIQSISLESKQ